MDEIGKGRTKDRQPVRVRKKIWEIRGGYHCSIVGTCLSLGELKRICRKAGLSFHGVPAEYEIHSAVVSMADTKGALTQCLQKHLDRKYRTSILRFAKARSEPDLACLWDQARDSGDIPGPYWAVMSHPAAGRELLSRAFGEVHMLSHLVGASNRSDIRRLRLLDVRSQGMEKALREAKRALKTRAAEHERRMAELRGSLAESQQALGGLSWVLERVRQLENGDDLRVLKREVKRCRAESQADRERALEAERAVAEMERRQGTLEKKLRTLEAELREKTAECTCIEDEFKRLLEALSADPCPDCGTDRCPSPRLCGKRVLYVGGRKRLIQHYRTVVERHGGEFLYHDGGFEESRTRLDEVMARADTVLCPVDCVSHDACQKVKSTCKKTSKPFVMLRSSGLSTLARNIGRLADFPIPSRTA